MNDISHEYVIDTVDAQMIDHSNGTYTYCTQPDTNVTISVLLYTQSSVFYDTLHNTVYAGTVVGNTSYPQIYVNHAYGLVSPSRSDSVSAHFYMKLKALKTDFFTFYLQADGYTQVWFNGVSRLNGTLNTLSFTENLVQDQYYDIKISFREATSPAYINLYWSYTGQTQTPHSFPIPVLPNLPY